MSDKNGSNYEFLTTGSIPKVILTMAVPTVVSMLVTSFYNMADTFFVGRINTQATAAVGVSFSLMSVIQAIAFLFGQGSGTYISRRLGAKDVEDASRMASTAFFAALGVSCLITLFGFIFLDQLAKFLGSTPTILPYAKTFMSCILIGCPFMISTLVINNQMRFQGNASLAMYGILSGAVINVMLVPLFIFVFDMGILGAGLGTLLGQFCGFCVIFTMSRKGNNLRINPRHITFSYKYAKEIIRGGSPSLTRQGLMAISTSMLNVAAGVYGDAAIAAMSVVTRICFFIQSVVIGIGQGFQPLCGFCYGAKLYQRVRDGYMFAVKASAIFLIVCVAAGAPFADTLVRIFRDDEMVIAVGTPALRWQMLTFPLVSVIQMSNMMLQTTGRALPANILAASRNGFFFIPSILILPYFFGLDGVEAAQALSDFLSFLLATPLALWMLGQLKGK
ncbi:MAG: MATE family efflux transporter [Paludibacteraceae bacterium]|nr:MATE family efflux transporter [Paludibacteraceae bacterium]